METTVFFLAWLALAWCAARPLARKAVENVLDHQVLAFIVTWLCFAVIAGIPAFVLTMIWPVTLLGLACYAAYLFIPGVAVLVGALEAKIQKYLD